MVNNKNTLLLDLNRLGLRGDEARVYLTLLEDEPMSHLEIARQSGVNRTKVYRVADSLIKRGLITEQINDEGRELAANDPANLESALTTAEEKVKIQRTILNQTLPALQTMYAQSDQPSPSDFIVNTYEGTDGFKQMLWNELKTKKEILIFGDGAIEDLVGSGRWAERHRQKTLEAGYKVREMYNPGAKPGVFTKNREYLKKAYRKRIIPAEILPLSQQICVYNDTVAVYNWEQNQKVGYEVVNSAYAKTWRTIFEHYWRLAKA